MSPKPTRSVESPTGPRQDRPKPVPKKKQKGGKKKKGGW